MANPEMAPLGARSRALVRYAVKLTRSPAAVTQTDLVPLREAGLDARGIHDVAAVVAYFNFVNRIALGLGVELEDESP
ncbi:MAG: carboxymuconolactone decarboxylase family protein [Gemmatimonadaceae bacterium]